MKSKRMLIGILTAVLFVFSGASQANLVALYDADSATTAPSPTTGSGIANWGVAFGGAPSASAFTIGTENTWKIVANTSSFVYYNKGGTTGIWDLASNDWVATARIQVQYATPAPGGVMLRVDDGQDVWTIGYQLTSASDNGWTYIKADGTYATPQRPEDVDKMQTWEMRFKSSTQTLEYYLDGTKVGPTLTRADVQNSVGGFETIRWGRHTSASASTTHHWNYVSLEIIPEPATVALLALGSLLLRKRSVVKNK